MQASAFEQTMTVWGKESYTLLVIAALVGTFIIMAKAFKPILDTRLKIEEERTKQEVSRAQAADAVSRAAPEIRATAEEVGRVAKEQAQHAIAQSGMTRDLVLLQERLARSQAATATERG